MLLKAQERQETIAHLRFLIQIKGTTLNQENQGELNSYNNLLKSYMDLIDPSKVSERESFADSKKENELKLSDLSSIDFTKFIIEEPINKNFAGSIEFITNEGK